MGNRKNLPHHEELNPAQPTQMQNEFTEKKLLRYVRMDNLLQPAAELMKKLSAFLDSMEAEVDSLQKHEVFDTALLNKKLDLEAEIHKRIGSQQILEKYRKDMPLIIESTRNKLAAINASKDAKHSASAMSGFDAMIKTQLPQFEEMFTHRLEREKADLEFLKFMVANYEDYEIKEGVISFGPHGELTEIRSSSEKYRGCYSRD